MNSSTSNSDKTLSPAEARVRGKSLWRALAAVFCFFVILEGITRFKFFDMSKDYRRFRTYSRRAAQLIKEPGLRVALVGNSATERGVNPELLQQILREKGLAVSVKMFVADSSHISTWKYMMNHYFWSRKTSPDVILTPYFTDSLQDGNVLEAGRLAQFFTSRGDWPQVMREDITDPAGRLDFMVSALWATYAARDRLKERTLSIIVPDYQKFVRKLHKIGDPNALDNAVPDGDVDEPAMNPPAEVNAIRNTAAWMPGDTPAPAAPRKSLRPRPAYHTLEQYLRTIRSHNAHVCFIAFPLRARKFDIDAEVPDIVRNGGGAFIDMRRTAGMKPEMYVDSVHLKPEGQDFYTRQLANRLETLLRNIPIAQTGARR